MKTPEEILSKLIPIQGNLITIDTAKVCMELYAAQFKQPEKQKKSMEERKTDFIMKVSEWQKNIGAVHMQQFIEYWTEHNDGGKLMRFEMKKNQPFNISRRLATWKTNQKNFNNGKPEKRSTESAAHSFITE